MTSEIGWNIGMGFKLIEWRDPIHQPEEKGPTYLKYIPNKQTNI